VKLKKKCCQLERTAFVKTLFYLPTFARQITVSECKSLERGVHFLMKDKEFLDENFNSEVCARTCQEIIEEEKTEELHFSVPPFLQMNDHSQYTLYANLTPLMTWKK